jgi:hypothetical protein
MAHDSDLAAAINKGWIFPVHRLGLIDLQKAPWIGIIVVDGYKMGLDNIRIATMLRSYGGVMSTEERKARNIKGSTKLGAAFYDALTPAGLVDITWSSKVIASRTMRSGIWQRDAQSCHDMPEDWCVVFNRGPKCCEQAMTLQNAILPGYPPMPLPDCDMLHCFCRAIATPKPKEVSNAAVIIGSIVFILVAMALAVLSRKH